MAGRRRRPEWAVGSTRSSERIVTRNAIRKLPGDIDVDAKQLAEEGAAILRIVVRIPTLSAIPHADVEIAIGAELPGSAVVLDERLVDREQQTTAFAIGDVGIIGAGAELLDKGIAIGADISVGHKEPATSSKLRMERQSE